MTEYVSLLLENDNTFRSRDQGQRGTSPCVERMLEQRHLDQIVAFGLPERPNGVRVLVMRTLNRILSGLHQNILAASAVHQAVKKFIHVCIRQGDLNAMDRKTDLMRLLCTLCKLLRDPALMLIFFELKTDEVCSALFYFKILYFGRCVVPRCFNLPLDWVGFLFGKLMKRQRVWDRIKRRSGVGEDGKSPDRARTRERKINQIINQNPPVESPSFLSSTRPCRDFRVKFFAMIFFRVARSLEPYPNPYPNSFHQVKDFLIFTALLPHINDGDADAEVALEALLALARLPDPSISSFIAKKTDFGRFLVGGLIEHYDAMEKAAAGAGFAHYPTPRKRSSFYVISTAPGDAIARQPAEPAAHEVMFLKRFEYINSVASTTFPELAEHLAKVLANAFIARRLCAALNSVEEKKLTWATRLCRKIIEKASARSILDRTFEVLLGKGRGPESEDEKKAFPLRTKLIRRMDDQNPRLAQATLALFDSVIASRNQFAIDNLVLRNLEQGLFLRPAARVQFSRKIKSDGFKYGLDLLRELRIPRPGTRTTDRYLLDAQTEVTLWLQACQRWNAPLHPSIASPSVTKKTVTKTKARVMADEAVLGRDTVDSGEDDTLSPRSRKIRTGSKKKNGTPKSRGKRRERKGGPRTESMAEKLKNKSASQPGGLESVARLSMSPQKRFYGGLFLSVLTNRVKSILRKTRFILFTF